MPYSATRISCLLFLLAALCLPPPASAARLDEQRAAFREAYADAELGIWRLDPARQALLADYVLWPDLRAAYLRATLKRAGDDEIREFLATYGDLKPARELRYRYALHLAARGRHADYLELYRKHYATLAVARLDCAALAAELKDGKPGDVFERAKTLWLTGRNQVSECDPVFAALRKAQLLDEALYRQRFELAIDERQLPIARYLARSLPESFRQTAQRWTDVYGSPRRFLEQHDPAQDSATYRRQLRTAIEQLAYAEPQLAADFWQQLGGRYAFAEGERAAVSRHVVLWLARNHRDNAYSALIDLSGEAVDDEVLRWRVRTALRQNAWSDVILHIQDLPAEELATPQWQYWFATAVAQNDPAAARPIFAKLAGERSYYGFLAADALDLDYDFGHAELRAIEAVQHRLATTLAFVRARELFLTGQDGRGRSEWDAAVRQLSADEQVQAAILAHRWGWHSRAIATAAQNDHYDDLNVRYPLPYADAFARFAEAANIRPSWALGVARSESLFMPDIRSAAGAIGVMQLTPSTGRITAREIKAPYAGLATLTDPLANIRLGTWFLGNMHSRFADNPVLATAAYNAGPQRVEAWLPRDASLDARIWIETIPYAETRDYVRRVLTADTIFHWRMAGNVERLSARLPDVQAAGPRVAAN
jgi:peptidoglycan lytic transglycosylase